jgi:hypothetical protein
MNQNSLQRLLEGIASALREAVMPEISDPYARAQVEAAAGLLDNLAPRIGWQASLIEAEVDRIVVLLERATAIAGTADLPTARQFLAAGPSGSLEDDRRAALLALGQVQEHLAANSLGDALDADISGFTRWQLHEQASRLRPPIGRRDPSG